MASVLPSNLSLPQDKMCVKNDKDDEEDDKTLEEHSIKVQIPPILSNVDPEDPFAVLYDHIVPREGRTLFFSRHGESEYNVQERIGGDPPLTPRGTRYAKALGQYMNTLALDGLKIWTSTLCRTALTAQYIKGPKMETPLLNELNSGYMDGLTYKEVQKKYPEEYQARDEDKLNYRYPGGESYVDCCHRVAPILAQMEAEEDNLIIVAHQAILRCIFGYLLKRPLEDVPHIKIPQHAIMQVTFDGGENVVDFIRMPIEHIEQGVIEASTD